MNDFEIPIRHFWIAIHPFHSVPRYHEVCRWAGLIVDDQLSRADQHIDMPGRPALLPGNPAAKLPVRAGPNALAIHKATHNRALDTKQRHGKRERQSLSLKQSEGLGWELGGKTTP